MKCLKIYSVILLAGCLSVSQAWAKNLAGFVIVSVGNVTAVEMETNQTRKLKRRSKIYEGEEIRTESGAKAQLKFKDKGVISLKENSALQISEFQYTGHEGAPEKSFFKLVKGGFRAISGAIGKQNQEDYRVDTPLATIGIRGTHYQADFSKRLSVSVLNGAVELSNSAGSLSIGDGFDFRNAVVNSAGSLPQGLIEPVNVVSSVQERASAGGDSESSDGKGSAMSDEEKTSLDADVSEQKMIATKDNAPSEHGYHFHADDPEIVDDMVPMKEEDEDDEDEKNPNNQLKRTVAAITDTMEPIVENTDTRLNLSDADVPMEVLGDAVREMRRREDRNISELGETIVDVADRDNIELEGPILTSDGTVIHHGDGSIDGGAAGSGSADTTDARISPTEQSQLGSHIGLVTVAMQPDNGSPSGEMYGGYAIDASTGTTIFVDRGAPPTDLGYDSLPIDFVVRSGVLTTPLTVAARNDVSIDTTLSDFAWDEWANGVVLQTDPTDNTVDTLLGDPAYWFTARAANAATIPTSGEARFDQTFLLVGQGSAGPIVDDDAAAVSIAFTLDWMNMSFGDGEIKIVNGVSGDKSQQTSWKFADMTGTLINTDGNVAPFLEFDMPPVGEVCANMCSIPSTAEGEIRAVLLNGLTQLAGSFSFWEQGNTAEWVTGIFAIGEEERFTTTEAQNINQVFWGAYQRHPMDSTGATTSPILGGKSETPPAAGDFLMVDQFERDYGAVIRLGSGVEETTNPGGSAAIHGHTVAWGAWNGSSVDTTFTSNPTFDPDKYTWISFSPVDPATMDSLSAEVSFSLPYAFYGWQYDSGSGADIPLDLERGFVNVDLGNDTFDGTFIFTGTGRFDVNFSGSTRGDGLTIESTTAYFNGAPISVDLGGQYVGSSFADGLAGSFRVGDPTDTDVYATAVFGFGRDERISPTQIGNMQYTGFMSIDQTDTGAPTVEAGLATQPTSGIFTFRNFDIVNSNVVNPLVSTPSFNSALLGTIPVDWGVWDDPTGSASVQNNPLDPSSSSTFTDAIAWVVSSPSDPADIPTTGVTAYNNIVGFTGYSNGVPLDPVMAGDITLSVNFASQTFTAQMDVTASVDSWSMSYAGSLSGNKLAGSGAGTYNGGQAASGIIDGALVGTGATTSPGSGPEGVIGAFKNHVDADHTIHSSGVFVLGQ